MKIITLQHNGRDNPDTGRGAQRHVSVKDGFRDGDGGGVVWLSFEEDEAVRVEGEGALGRGGEGAEVGAGV